MSQSDKREPLPNGWTMPPNVEALISCLNSFGGTCYMEHADLIRAFFAQHAAPSTERPPTQNEFLTLLDDLEGIQAGYEMAGGDAARQLDKDRDECRKKLLALFAAAQEATYPPLDPAPVSAIAPTLTGCEHDLKCWPDFFEEVYTARKPFEIRQNDRDFKVGDALLLREWVPGRDTYTGRQCRRVVTYMTNYHQRDGYVVMGLSDGGSHG